MKETKENSRTKKEISSSIIRGLNQALAHSKGDKSYTLSERKHSISPLPNYKSEEIKIIRKRLNLSQNLFALALGVSKKTVEAWESGRNIPQGPAQRILFIIKNNPVILNDLKIVS
jgi:putative transcriptional regulator